jgi:3-dehydroquinate dehydratase type I
MLGPGAMAARLQGADLVEIRLDYLIANTEPVNIRKEADLPRIATLRREREGGRYRGSEDSRWQMLLDAAGAFDYVDLEFGFASGERVDKLHQRGSRVIVSHHDFYRTPSIEEMLSILFRSRETGCDILKIATMAGGARDVIDLLTLPRYISPIVVVPMGKAGRTGRALAPLLGSEFGYGALDGMPPVAPGMLTVRQMRQIYDLIGKATG